MVPQKWGKAPYQLTLQTGETRIVMIGGRVRWCIKELRGAAYVWDAINVHGIPIRDDWEAHEGEHPERYKLWWLYREIHPLPPKERGVA